MPAKIASRKSKQAEEVTITDDGHRYLILGLDDYPIYPSKTGTSLPDAVRLARSLVAETKIVNFDGGVIGETVHFVR
jgi:hypothetical protein